MFSDIINYLICDLFFCFFFPFLLCQIKYLIHQPAHPLHHRKFRFNRIHIQFQIDRVTNHAVHIFLFIMEIFAYKLCQFHLKIAKSFYGMHRLLYMLQRFL